MYDFEVSVGSYFSSRSLYECNAMVCQWDIAITAKSRKNRKQNK